MSYVLFKRRPLVETAKPVAVEITGTGYSRRCYATVNGETYIAAASGIEVLTGNVITFGIYTKDNASAAGSVTIDGTTVATTTSANTATTYEWTVPDDISAIAIALNYSSYSRKGTITVTTS